MSKVPDHGKSRGDSAKSDSKLRTRPKAPTARELLTPIVALMDIFCEAHLNADYALLCRQLAEKLAAKRPSPLLRGKLETWACGIIRTIGWVNFLDDRDQSPHLKLTSIDRAFGVGESTGQAKAKAIRHSLKIHQFDHRWMLPSRWESCLTIWLLRAPNGLVVDIRRLAVAEQRAAFKQGLIPYVPADRSVTALQEQIASSGSRRLFQFKITLRGAEPAIWRRIQVLDDTLDRLHEHLQTAMGWTNSHLNEFMIQGRRCGDPELLDEDFDAASCIDSRQTMMSAVLAVEAAPLPFEYRYDVGDGWVHDVIFEGSPRLQPGVVYPQCLEGERACPPEDVGGLPGYENYLVAMADSGHPQHEEKLNWKGAFDPDSFSPHRVTHQMQEGVPDWRTMV